MARNSILNSKAKKLKLLEIMVIKSWIVRKSWIFQKSYKNGRFIREKFGNFGLKLGFFIQKITLFSLKYTKFVFMRCSDQNFDWIWLFLRKPPTKWQFWFEIGVFWRVGILGMVPDQIRKRNDLEWFRVRVEFRSKEMTTFGTIHDNDNSWSDWWP